MITLRSLLTLPFLGSLALASPVFRRAFNANVDASQAEDPDICGEIIQANLDDGYVLFLAEDVVDCLTSVPFQPAPATRFLQYIKNIGEYHATTAYLKDPPAEYQQPPVDLVGGLAAIQNKVSTNAYHNQYAFEIDIQRLLQQTHDDHVAVFAGITAPFTFASPYDIVSVSADGKQVPEVYLYEDLLRQVTEPSYVASPLSTVNGKSVVDYLTSFAARHSQGMVEPQADWNELVASPAQFIANNNNALTGGAQYYDEYFSDNGYEFNVTFKNGTNNSAPVIAYYSSPGCTGPLATGGDWYNLFALGNLPANYDQACGFNDNSTGNARRHLASRQSGSDQSNLTSWNSISQAYPADTISYQEDLGPTGTGWITGYFLKDISTAVLSVPSFSSLGQATAYSQAIADFFNNATQLDADKIIVDLQQNAGGDVSLAIDLFRQFFPNKMPFLGSRGRSFPQADVLGQTFNDWYRSLAPDSDNFTTAVSSEWVILDRLDASTGKNFTSWQDYASGPSYGTEKFTKIQQYDLANPVFDDNALGFDFPDCFYQRNCVESKWAAKNITLLTDGLCASSCSLFVQMMQHEGVGSVVVGGRPESGPMQTASGTRGAAAYTLFDLLDDFEIAGNISSTAAAALNPNQDSGLLVSYAGFTLRDQMESPSATTPLQVLYKPADCRLYWTLANFNDYSRLWHDVAQAAFKDQSMCVAGSTNVKSAPARKPLPPKRRSVEAGNDPSDNTAAYIMQGLEVFGKSSGVQDNGEESAELTFCKHNSDCTGGQECYTWPLQCGCSANQCSSSVTVGICTPKCKSAERNSRLSGCSDGTFCLPTSSGTVQKSVFSSGSGQKIQVPKGLQGNGQSGVCKPAWDNRRQGKSRCAALNDDTIESLLLNGRR